MKPGRSTLIAVQSLITAVLLGVVAVTLLSPDHQAELFGVNVPGPGPGLQGGPGNQATGPGARPGGEAGRGGQAGGGGRAGGTSSGTGAAGTGVPTPVPTEGALAAPPAAAPSGGVGDGAPAPPEDEYGDTLARLSAAVD